MPILGQFQFRRDSSANWSSVNPVLLAGELGIETNTDLFKIGDGTTAWNALAYGGLQGIQGEPGPTGATGATGTAGTNGTNGTNGWSPILSVVSDGERRVLQVVDWTGGTGTKPATGSYIGPTGFVATPAQAVDIRGATGATGATGAAGTSPNTFTTFAVAGQSDVVADNTSDTLTLVAGTNISITTNATTDAITINSTAAGGNSFANVAVGGNTLAADTAADTLTINSGTGITLTSDAATDTFTITNAGVTSVSVNGGAAQTGAVSVAVPTAANAAPPSIAATSSTGTTTGEYALENHTHAGVTSVNGQQGAVTVTVPTPANAAPANVGTTASIGTATGEYALEDHVHALPTVNANVGSFTSANITVDAQGRVTAAANGSGGGGGATTALTRVTANLAATTAATAANLEANTNSQTAFSTTLAANQMMQVDAILDFTTAAATTGIAIGCNVTTNAAGTANIKLNVSIVAPVTNAGAATSIERIRGVASTTLNQTVGVAVLNTASVSPQGVAVQATLVNSGTADVTFRIVFGTEVGASAVTLLADSVIKHVKQAV